MLSSLSTALWQPSTELLEKNPKFCAFWKWMMTSMVSWEPELKEVENMRSAKLKYLIRKTLVDELHEFNTEARNHPVNNHEIKLHDILHHSLTVAGAMQNFKIHNEQEDYLLGMSPKDFVHRTMDIQYCRGSNQELIPRFEAHINSLFQEAVMLFAPDLKSDQNVEELILELLQSRKRSAVQWEDVYKALVALIEAHEETKVTWENVAHLLEHYILGTQFKKDQDKLKYQETLIQLHKAHTEFLLLSIMIECYTPDAIKALTVLRTFIDREIEDARKKHEKFNDQLNVCKKLGPEYHKLALEYTVTKEHLRQAKQTLKGLEDMEQDLDGMSSDYNTKD